MIETRPYMRAINYKIPILMDLGRVTSFITFMEISEKNVNDLSTKNKDV